MTLLFMEDLKQRQQLKLLVAILNVMEIQLLGEMSMQQV